jgi:hypothetical protein
MATTGATEAAAAEQPAKLRKHDSSLNLQVGMRVWCHLAPGERQGILSSLVAMITLTLYCGWTTVLLGLMIASWWSSTAL